MLLDARGQPHLLEVNTNPGFVGRAGEAEHGHFEGLFAKLNRIMCDFMWTSVISSPPADVRVLYKASESPTAASFTHPSKWIDGAATPALVPLSMRHYEDLFHAVNDATVMKTVQKGFTWSLYEIARRCQESEGDWASKSQQYHRWAIMVHGRAYGMLLWHRQNATSNFQLRILLSRRVQGHGIATSALKQSIQLISDMYPADSGAGGVTRLEADVHVGNGGSAKLMLRCGFRNVGEGHYGRTKVSRFAYDIQPASTAAPAAVPN